MHKIYKTIEKNPVYLAGDHHSICGFIELSIHEKAPGCVTNKIGFIEGWYVHPAYRQIGVGKMLVEAGERWARSIGCKEMASDTTERYPISPRAHIALGYEEVDSPSIIRRIYFSQGV